MRHSTQTRPSRAVSDPACFPVKFDAVKGTLAFVHANRKRLAELSFLDGRQPLSDHEPFEIPLAGLPKEKEAPGPDWNFIFHPGFSCSTLLARCLDREGACLALKEPGLLNDLSEAKRLGIGPARDRSSWIAALSLSLRLLFRPHRAGERVIVKASNADNGLLRDILALNPAARAVFLTIDLKSFLLAVAKGGKSRRAFVRRLLAAHAADEDIAPLFPAPMGKVAALDDLKAAAVLWRLQNEIFRQASDANPRGSFLFIECESFLGDPENTLAQASAFFGLPALRGLAEGGARAGILTHHAKTPAFRYDPDIRAAEFRAIEAYLGDALRDALAWDESLSHKKKPLPAFKVAV